MKLPVSIAVAAAATSALLAGLLLAAPALAIDQPIEGLRLKLQAEPEGERRLRFKAKDPAIAAPFADPREGASLVVWNSAAADQCRVEIALDPAIWKERKQDGESKGYLYRTDPSLSQGLRRIKLRPGKIVIEANGESWPCGLGADVQVLPVWVELRVDGDRYCAAFGGDAVRKDNRPGLTKLRKAPAPAECLDRDLSVASLNVLHGALGCAEGTQCRLVDRLDLLIDWIADSGCADVMTFQEVFILDAPGFVNARTIIEDGVAEVCPWAYESVAIPISVFDDQLILSRDRILESSAISIPTAFRSVTWARVDHPIGPVDVFSTHLASGADNGGEPCNVAGCPQACRDEGLTIRECQARLMAEFIVEKHDVAAPAVATGDFNDEPGTITYLEFTDRGWLDVYLEAGNPECDPDTGVGCTSGREDENLTDLESPAAGVNRRIDYIFLIPPGEGSVCAAEIDGAGDADGDGQFTRHFTDEPNPFDATCGPAPDRPCWPSDHEGVELDLNCAAAGGGD